MRIIEKVVEYIGSISDVLDILIIPVFLTSIFLVYAFVLFVIALKLTFNW